MKAIAIATQDAVSEAVASKLISAFCPGFEVGLKFGGKGNGYLRSNIAKFVAIAKVYPFLLITDLDRRDCPAALVREWLQGQFVPPHLVFRVAVREIESWLLADHTAMRVLLGNKGSLPAAPDDLPDPKQTLLRLAKKAPGDIRRDLIADRGSTATQGIGYNSRLVNVVEQHWNPNRAAENSASLARACARLSAILVP